MFKELKHLIYLIITFASIFFVIKFYISDKNVKKTHIILGNYEEYLAKEYDKLPIVKKDTGNIIDYQTEVDEFINKKKKRWWELIK